MPVQQGEDEVGPYYRWGEKGKKYYYHSDDEDDEEEAYQAALRQGRAIHARR